MLRDHRYTPFCITINLSWLTIFLLSGCSPKRILLNQIGEVFESAGDIYLTENDPQLVKDAFPFNLKTIEILLQQDPDNPTLLLTATSGYVTYAYAFIMEEADRIIVHDYQAGKKQYRRALNLFNRARNYGMRGLLNSYPDIEVWMNSTTPASVQFKPEDVPLLYWTAAAIGGAISASQGDPALVVEIPKVGWLLEQALKTDPDWNKGSLYTAMISFSMKRPDAGRESEVIARKFFSKAVMASNGNDCSPYIRLAEAVSVINQNREEFIELLNHALDVDTDKDPELRLANILAQSRAHWLLDRVDELFY